MKLRKRINSFIFKLLRAYPEKWAIQGINDLDWINDHQIYCGRYPIETLAYQKMRTLVAWVDFLIEVCLALESKTFTDGFFERFKNDRPFLV